MAGFNDKFYCEESVTVKLALSPTQLLKSCAVIRNGFTTKGKPSQKLQGDGNVLAWGEREF